MTVHNHTVPVAGLTDEQIHAVDDYLDRADRTGDVTVASIVRAIPDLEQRMDALAWRRAHRRQRSA
ncbi:MAG: hypothetical protein WAX14_02030 [Rhodococcus sp. (in: high G+C Gram-positive bacteria)]|uniref:hypothetical protein n=1 Tax=Rhodococcus sp. TaxID=1831 RepID=UPI003BB6D3E8